MLVLHGRLLPSFTSRGQHASSLAPVEVGEKKKKKKSEVFSYGYKQTMYEKSRDYLIHTIT